jgi:hypothetical protein
MAELSRKHKRCIGWGHRWSEEPVAPPPNAQRAPRGYQYIYWRCDTCSKDKRTTLHRATGTVSHYYFNNPKNFGLHGAKRVDYKFDYADQFNNGRGKS